ncbi:MAG: hypothetical protein ABIS03_04510, partial [Gemmatimonadaceae bacterium]
AAPPGAVPGILKGLKFSNSDAAWIGAAVAHWHSLEKEMRFGMMPAVPPPDAVLRRWAAATGRTRFATVFRLAAARWAAEREAGLAAPERGRVASVYRRAIRVAYNDAIEVGDIAVNGRDLEKLGIKGPAVGRVLRSLLESVINDPATNSREFLLAAASREKHSPHAEDGI